ncbi:hypothetical protein N665_0256s0021 [Sinapis alba]|nr:hypothetical protein N665_0256s0021 [Sinapis alba]
MKRSILIAKDFLNLDIGNPLTPPPSSYMMTRTFSTSNKKRPNRTDVKDPIKLFCRMIQSRPLPSIIEFSKPLSKLAKTNKFHLVISLFNQMEILGITHDLYTYNILINCLSRCSRFSIALSVISKMMKLGFEPDVFTLSSLINGLCRNKRVFDAIDLVAKMETMMGCKPDVFIYNTIIDGLCKKRLVNNALDLFQQMDRNGVRADVVTYNSLITRSTGRCLLMREMVMRNVVPNVITFTALIDASVKEGNLLEAERLFHEEMINRWSIVPDVFTYNSMINGLCMHGRLDEAKQMLELMLTKECSPDTVTYNTLINGFCKSKRVDDVMKLFGDMSERGLVRDTVTYNTIIQGYFQAGKPDAAQGIFRRMDSPPPNLRTYSILLYGLFSNGKTEKALVVFRDRQKSGMGLDITTYNIMIHIMCKAGYVEDAWELFCSLLTFSGVEPDVVSYTTMISGFCRKRLWHEADELYRKMHEDGLLPI